MRVVLALALVSLVPACSQAHTGRPRTSCCLPGAECVAAGTADPTDECRVCDPALSREAYSAIWGASCGADSPTLIDLPPGGVSGIVSGFDVDGDGFGDIVVAVGWGPEYEGGPSGRVIAYSGRDSSVLRDWHATGDETGFGFGLTLGPSVDGDGLADIAVGTWVGPTRDVLVLSVVQDAPIARIHSDLTCATAGEGLSLGDVDGDARSDILVSTRRRPPSCPEAPSALLYSSDAVLLRSWPAVEGSVGGIGLAIGPDLDGDGGSDLVIRQPTAVDLSGGYVDVYGTRGARRIHHWPAAEGSGVITWLGPDASGDGAADVLTGEVEDEASTRVRTVMRSGVDGSELWERTTWPDAGFGPDANGDGLGDVAVTARPDPYAADAHGADVIIELLDGATGEPIKRLLPPPMSGFLTLSYVGDIDGDGRADVVANGHSSGRPVVFVFGSAR